MGLSLGGVALAEALTEPTLSIQRQLFLKAEKSLKQKQWPLYAHLKKQLQSYPLLPYLLYLEYEQGLSRLNVQTFKHYLNQYADSPLAENLRHRWLQAKAKQADWPAFLEAYQPTEDVSLQCHYWWASLQAPHNNRPLVLKQIGSLWMSGQKRPKSCDAAFEVYEQEAMTRPLAWQRVKRLIQADQLSLARKMSVYLKRSENRLVEQWIRLRQNPYQVLQHKLFADQHPAHLEMIVDAVSLIAKENPERAIQLWQKISRQYPFQERHWGLVVRAIGLCYAIDKHPDAEKWLSRVPALYTNEAVHEWRVRSALLREDWSKALQWLKALPAHLAREEQWQYWQARVLDRINQPEQSQILWHKLSHTRSYYGLLASHQLLKPYSANPQKHRLDPLVVQIVNKHPAVARARELQALKRYADAKAEWKHLTGRMSDPQKHAAAYLALQWNLPNWSLLALAKAHNKDDLSLRFPIVYADRIFREAHKHQIDPAWILALTRQESAFMPHARSNRGAIGLMQLKADTAAWVAEKKRLRWFGESTLFEPHTNIELGSNYLKMLLEKYQHNPLLATVAYNAGPGRVQKWIPAYDMAADLWIEGIPYKETREYVKNILTYTAIYQEMLGKKPSISHYMRYIPSQKTLVAQAPSPKKT
jgi:soluble lytic murein transglycosylase